MTGNFEHNSSTGRVDWCTPRYFIEIIKESFGRIALDPCSNPRSIVGATESFALPTDGLQQRWFGRSGIVYVNPPYGAVIGKWTTKCLLAGANGSEVIALVPARVDTRWWNASCAPPKSTAVCFWQGRIQFGGAIQGAMFPNAVVYWGPRIELFKSTFRRYGAIWVAS